MIATVGKLIDMLQDYPRGMEIDFQHSACVVTRIAAVGMSFKSGSDNSVVLRISADDGKTINPTWSGRSPFDHLKKRPPSATMTSQEPNQ